MSTAQETERDPLSTRKFKLSAIVVLVILAGLALVILVPGDDADTPPAFNASSCNLPDSNQTGIVGIPDTGWVIIGAGEHSIAVPQTPDHGPALQTDGVWHCWARSPLGAVSAATAFAAMPSTGNAHDLYQNLTVDSPERDALLADTPAEEDPYGGGLSVEAFRLVDYTGDTAEVAVVMGDGTNYAAATIDLTYQDGDWRYDPPSSLEPEFSQPATLDGYTEFRRTE